MVTNILFFLNFYNSRYDVLFLLIRRNSLLLTYLLTYLILTVLPSPYRKSEVDGCPSKENFFGQSTLLINTLYIVFP